MKKRLINRLIPVMILCTLLAGSFSVLPAYASSSITINGMYSGKLAGNVLTLLNETRAESGRDALVSDRTLTECAMQRAAELSVLYSHDRPDGTRWYTVGSAVSAENIAMGEYSAASVMTDWMNSEGHRNNILDTRWASVGIGCFVRDNTIYWVQEFGTDTGSPYTFEGNTNAEVSVPVSNPQEESASQSKLAETVSPEYNTSENNTSEKTNSEDTGFTDVSSENWFYQPVCYVQKNGIMTGLTAILFGASEQLSRAQFVTIIYRLAGSPDVSYSAVFPDVREGYFYTAPVMWAYANGIMTGCADGRFKPGDVITREQIAAVMYRYAAFLGYDRSESNDLLAYPDADTVSDFADAAVRWSVGAGLINGDRGTLSPKGNASRAQCAAIIMRFMEHYK